MSIKPVDFQVMIPKSGEVSKIRNDEQNKNYAVQQQQSSSLQNKAESSLKQVYSRESAQSVGLREKQEKHSGGRHDENGKSKEKKEKSEKRNTELKTGTIDIKI